MGDGYAPGFFIPHNPNGGFSFDVWAALELVAKFIQGSGFTFRFIVPLILAAMSVVLMGFLYRFVRSL